MIEESRLGRVEFRVDKTSLIHIPIGKLSFTDEQLLQNLTAALDAIQRAKPTGAKGQYIKSIVLCSTMSPSVRLDIQPALALRTA